VKKKSFEENLQDLINNGLLPDLLKDLLNFSEKNYNDARVLKSKCSNAKSVKVISPLYLRILKILLQIHRPVRIKFMPQEDQRPEIRQKRTNHLENISKRKIYDAEELSLYPKELDADDLDLI